MVEHPDIKAMENEICRLQQEISRLHLLLDPAGISYKQPPVQEESEDTVLPISITEAHAKLLYSVFRGRKDVYSKRGLRKDGGSA